MLRRSVDNRNSPVDTSSFAFLDLKETDIVLMEMQRNRYLFSMVASCVAITGIVATWYLASRGTNAFIMP